MRDISFNLSGKIDPLLAEVLSQVSREAISLDIPFFIVGAMARDIVLELYYNLPARRSTRDLDIGVTVEEDYRICARMLTRVGTTPEGKPKRGRKPR